MSNRRISREDIQIDKQIIDDSMRLPTYRNSPTANFITDKNKSKICSQRKTKRNISEDSKSSARGKQSKNYEQKQWSLKRKGSQFDQMLKQLLDLKGKYKTLKDSYNDLIKQKVQTNKTTRTNQEQIIKLEVEVNQLKKLNQTYKSQVEHLQKQLQRIKKQSVKLIEVESYKTKRLQQNIKQKDRIIASRNQSSLSFCHQEIAMTQVKDYSNRLNINQGHISYRDRYNSINTQIVEQRILFQKDMRQDRDQQPTIECTLDNETNRQADHNHNRSSSASSSELQMNPIPCFKLKQLQINKKKNPFQNPFETLNECKSPNMKKKRSITNGKSHTGKKKLLLNKGSVIKGKKMTNQTFR